MTPNERFSEIQTFLGYLHGVRYGTTPIAVRNEILIIERTVVVPPQLEFGNGYTLQPFQNRWKPPIWSEKFDSQIGNWGSKKFSALY